MSVNQRT